MTHIRTTTLEYIRDMTAELRRLALRAGSADIAYLLDMARLEASVQHDAEASNRPEALRRAEPQPPSSN